MKQRITKISAKQTDCKRKQMFCGLRNETEIFLLLSFYRAVVIGDLQVILSNSNPPFLQQECQRLHNMFIELYSSQIAADIHWPLVEPWGKSGGNFFIDVNNPTHAEHASQPAMHETGLKNNPFSNSWTPIKAFYFLDFTFVIL